MVHYSENDLNSSFRSSLTADSLDKTFLIALDVSRKSACPTLRFALECNQVQTIAHRDDMSEDEKKASYFSCAELADMKQETKRIARWWNGMDNSNKDEMTIRGMESLVYKQVSVAKRASRRLAASAVFMEQEMMQDYQTCYISAQQVIAMEYMKFTAPALERAQQFARQDAMDAGMPVEPTVEFH